MCIGNPKGHIPPQVGCNDRKGSSEPVSLSPEDTVVYENVFKESLAMSLKGYILGRAHFVPEDMKVEVVEHTIGQQMRSSHQALKFVRFSGIFSLKASPYDLYRTYQTGIEALGPRRGGALPRAISSALLLWRC
jgi:hypothetical protein